MTEDELRAFLENSGKQPREFIEEILALTSASEVQKQFQIRQSREVSVEEAEATAMIWRKDFVESIHVIRSGGALGLDGWKPDV